MRKQLLVILSFFLLHYSFCLAQMAYPIVGNYKGCSAQGMAIHGSIAYLFSDGGRCRLFDLYKSKVIDEFLISSHSPQNHVNNACFGVEIGSFGQIPFLYITECKNKFRCFVEEILPDTTQLVQTISATQGGKMIGVLIWVVDKEKNRLYTVTRTDKTLKSEGYSLNTVTCYPLPKISDGSNIILTEKDVLEQYVLHFPSILQGAKIRKGHMYIVTGLQQSLSKRLDSKRAIQVVDLKRKKLEKTIDLTLLTTNEPEDMDFFNAKVLLYCGQEGGLYNVKLK